MKNETLTYLYTERTRQTHEEMIVEAEKRQTVPIFKLESFLFSHRKLLQPQVICVKFK